MDRRGWSALAVLVGFLFAAGSTAFSQNLLANPGNETGPVGPSAWWTPGASWDSFGYALRVTKGEYGFTGDAMHDGRYGIKMFGDAADLRQTNLPVVSGATYLASGWFYHSSTEDVISNSVFSTRMFLHVEWFDAGNALLGHDYTANHNGMSPADRWMRIERVVTAPAHAHHATFHVESDCSAGSGSVFGDSFYFGPPPRTRYVSSSGLNIVPFENWANAATSLAEAVASSTDGDTLLVTAGVYRITSELRLTNALVVQSVGGMAVVTQALGSSRCFTLCHPEAVLDGFRVTGGRSASGGGVYCDAGTVRACTVAGNSAMAPYEHCSECGPSWVFSANGSGGGVYCGSLGLVENCTVTDNRVGAWGYGVALGGGVYCSGGRVRDCVLLDNTSENAGGGLYVGNTGLVERCVLRNNRTIEGCGGGGVSSDGSMLDRCTVISNTALAAGGGVYCYGGRLRNSLVAYNTAATAGGGVYLNDGSIRSCTIVSNRCAANGGGIARWGTGDVLNSIVYGNNAATDADYSGSFAACRYVLSGTLLPGEGNSAVDPQFIDAAAGNFRLSPSSPGIDAGTNEEWMTGAYDVDGNARLNAGRVDLGAYERPRLPSVFHVSLSGGNVPPFNSWDTAAHSIAAAVGIATDGDEVVVAEGEYLLDSCVAVDRSIFVHAAGQRDATIIIGPQRDRCFSMTATGAVVEGFTIIGGNAPGADTLRPQCGGGALVLAGMLRNSAIQNCSAELQGGGIYCGPNALIQNCIVSNNAAHPTALMAYGYGGGIYSDGGRVEDCVVIGNVAQPGSGGGVYLQTGSALKNCDITRNQAQGYAYGAGAFCSSGATMEDCTVSLNGARDAYGAGGAYLAGTAYRCRFFDNIAQIGGGVYITDGGKLVNAVVSGNSSRYGGGVLLFNGDLLNCTITGNTAYPPEDGWPCGLGDGVYAGPGTIRNSIISGNGNYWGDFCYVNWSDQDGRECTYPNVHVSFSCLGRTVTSANSGPHPLPPGDGNTTNDPQFVDFAGGDFRLSSNSPCIDAGDNAAAPTNDLDDAPRPLDGDGDGFAVSDLGAYEFQGTAADSDGDGLPDGWETRFGRSPTQSCVNADADHDGLSDADEFVAGTDPNRPESTLEVLPADSAASPVGGVIQWASRTGRRYAIDRTDRLGDGFGEPIAAGIPATPPLNTYTDSTATARSLFYRIRIDR